MSSEEINKESKPSEDQDILEDDEEIIQDIRNINYQGIALYSRDWTIETIASQIKKGNIELNPKFQRRNAWNDSKRSKLIESLIIGCPIPEIVLAEDPKIKKSFIVIDGKQRLLTIAGFLDPSFNYWAQPKLTNLESLKELNELGIEELKTKRIDDYRKLENAEIRCTVLSNYKNIDVLYDIFYRLNTGSVSLSTQELRQVLHKGQFADYLIDVTNTTQKIHDIMGLAGPDNRLRDIEIILRYFSIILFGNEYTGNLKDFLDSSMGRINDNWDEYKPKIVKLYERLDDSIDKLLILFGEEPENHIGRKYINGKWEGRFNKVLFEVEAYYAQFLNKKDITLRIRKKFITLFQEMCENNVDFRNSIESTTKALESYTVRFINFQKLLNKAFSLKINSIPVKQR